MGALQVDEKNFQAEVVNSGLPVLVDFWAEWCGPCKMLSPIVDEVAEELKSQLKVVKVNVDDSQELAMQYGIMSIPTLLVFKKGEIVAQMVGAMPKQQLLNKIKPILN
ncbi:MAG: thioredoxin [Omnitrophica WOR_2 bacterium RIFCSPHIGHO2_01_FULL_48_9]|nr:MAG: thioredoxin [Omnitrophica WOR_2 bacterium RIFCSPHIGHO2_02_FULL_48_11]OGX31548.1 MAG: thioredoxin [Omnitrophica WOR_2 bacterium RIFCSPHIGHO2_01_FULL_48_9]